MTDIAILILAAGASSRMRGRDKLAERVAGEPLLRLQVRRAMATGHPVFVALPSADHPRVGFLAGLQTTPLFIPNAAEGMGVTLRDAVAQLPSCDALLVCLADLVALETADIAAVIAARKRAPDALVWRGATEAGKPGHPILFDASLRAQFAALSGDAGGAAILRPLTEQTCLVPLPGDRALLDLDTPEDWAAWRERGAK